MTPAGPARPAAAPVALQPVDRSHRAVLSNLGQLYRYDLSEGYGHLPNPDGTFNYRRLDRFLAGADPTVRAWLITAAGRTAGFVMTIATPEGPHRVHDFFVVRALRRSGVGRAAARLAIATAPGRWEIAFQDYNPGAREFWSQVAEDVAPGTWTTYDSPTPADRPSDRWITFTATAPTA